MSSGELNRMLKKILSLVLNYDRKLFRWLEEGIPRYEKTEHLSRKPTNQWSEVPLTELDNASYASGLEKDERNSTRTRTTRLSKQHERVGRVNQEIPDPWD